MKQQHELFTTNDNHNPIPGGKKGNAIIDYPDVCKYDLDKDISISTSIFISRGVRSSATREPLSFKLIAYTMLVHKAFER